MKLGAVGIFWILEILDLGAFGSVGTWSYSELEVFRSWSFFLELLELFGSIGSVSSIRLLDLVGLWGLVHASVESWNFLELSAFGAV